MFSKMKDLRLSENFLLSELMTTGTGLKNEPTAKEVLALKYLTERILQPIRNYYNVPVKINSGYRSDEVNNAIGGSKTSDHMKGYAADIEIMLNTPFTQYKVYDDIKNGKIPIRYNYDQLIYYKRGSKEWIHISHRYDGVNRSMSFEDKHNY